MRKEYDLKKLKRRQDSMKVDPEAGKIPISIRLDQGDVSLIKKEAERLGIPYQTLIGSILHRYTNGELIDKKVIEELKSLKSL